MKKLYTFLLSLFLLLSAIKPSIATASVSALNYSAFEPAKPCTLVITVSGVLASKRSGCINLGFSCLHFGTQFIGPPAAKVNLSLNMVSDNVLELICLDNPPKGELFEVEEDMPLESSVCEQLGYASIILRKGNYKVMKDDEGHLLVDLNCVSER